MRNELLFDNSIAIRIRNRSFQSVTDLYGNFSAGIRGLWLDEKHHTIVEIFGTHSPVDSDTGSIFCRLISLQVRHGNDHDLIGCGIIDSHQFGLEF